MFSVPLRSLELSDVFDSYIFICRDSFHYTNVSLKVLTE